MALKKRDIWEFGEGYYKVHLTNLEAYRKIKDTLDLAWNMFVFDLEWCESV